MSAAKIQVTVAIAALLPGVAFGQQDKSYHATPVI
jgi:hypothetical protein